LANDDVKRLGMDLFLAAAQRRLGENAETEAARVSANPTKGVLLADKDVAGLVQALREAPATVEAARQWAALLR
jgi:hypothetical protein